MNERHQSRYHGLTPTCVAADAPRNGHPSPETASMAAVRIPLYGEMPNFSGALNTHDVSSDRRATFLQVRA
jgi:hypothetical protein